MSVNESDIFEENDLYINGSIYKNTVSKTFNEFNSMIADLESTMSNSEINTLQDILNTDDIYINTLEEDVEAIINDNREKITGRKKIFNLDKTKTGDEVFKKPNHLRSEAKLLEESIRTLDLPNYQEIKAQKFSDCGLSSLHFFKHFCKKEIGKENNYIFNYRDNFLNDMSKIDKEFFKDYFNFNEESGIKIEDMGDSISADNQLIYEFSIYHPSKNSKTQQIAILGSCSLYELRDKIYCVLDEIHSINQQKSFFFIENTFYNDTRFDSSSTLSSKILENKIRKLNIANFTNDGIKCGGKKEVSKFNYNRDLYSDKFNKSQHIYEELSMGDRRLLNIHFRIGYPYLYRHMDYCDHIIMLVDVRVADTYDRSIKEQRSLVTYQKKIKRRICEACAFYYAKFLSINDKIGGESQPKVLFFCENCIKKLHEKEAKEGTIYSVKLIPYYHD
jgi:hypothetical protein